MPIKRLRHDTEIGWFASELAGRWKQGDGVEPFLRRLEPELSRMVRAENWSWASVALALNRAGIAYQSGRPWDGRMLCSKMASIRYESRRRAQRASAGGRGPVGERMSSTLASPQPPALPAVAIASRPAESDALGRLSDGEPEFRPAALKGWSGTKIVRSSGGTPERPTGSTQVLSGDAPAVIARLLGRK